MRLTEFWARMERVFGPSAADSVARDQVLSGLGNQTVHEALAAGTETRAVWLAVVDAFELPAAER